MLDAELAKGASDRVVLPCRRPRAWLPRSERAERPALHLAKRKSTWRPLVARAAQHHAGQRPARALADAAARVRAPNPGCAGRHVGRSASRAERCGSTPEPAPPRPRLPGAPRPGPGDGSLPPPPPSSGRASAGRCVPKRPLPPCLGSALPATLLPQSCRCSVRRRLLEAF